MKNKLINLIVIIFCLFILVEIFINKILIFNTISYSLNIWINSIIPSLFPFFILSHILISYNITNYIPKFIKNIFQKLFNVSNNIITIFFLSILSGFPSASRNIRIMYDKKMITKEEASHSLIFTHFSNPLFIMGTIGTILIKDDSLALIILISHYTPNIILGIFTRNYNIPCNIDYKQINNKSQRLPKIIIESIKNTIDTLLTIFGTLTCFLVLGAIITNIGNFNPYNASIIKGILEITIGIQSLSLTNIPKIYIAIITSMFLSFGGLAVHMQILSFLIDTDISYQNFFLARIIHAIISGFICFILYSIFR